MTETKKEIRARIEELNDVLQLMSSINTPEIRNKIEHIKKRIEDLQSNAEFAQEDIFSSVLRSHKAVCEAKKMGEKAAYGQDPAFYYAAAVSAEAGECLNKLVRGFRDGNNLEVKKNAVSSELPDIFIYGVVLAHVLDLDITKLVSEKVEVVIKRAENGYYGGPLQSITFSFY